METKQMKLKPFCEMYGLDYQYGLQIAHSQNSPCYKLGRRWYVDLEKWEKWRKTKHAESYKWA